MFKPILIASILAYTLVPTVQAAENLHYNLVEFNESASVRVPNDTMNVVLEIRANGTSRTEVNQTVTRRLNAVLARAKSAGSLFEIESDYRRTQPEYGERGTIRAWTDIAQVRINSRDFDTLAKMIADVQQHASVNSLSFSVSPEKRTAAINEASDQVLKTFQQRAQHMSKTLGFSGYKIVRIQFNQSFDSVEDGAAPAMMRAYAMSASAKVAPEVAEHSAGVQEIRQMINVSVQMH